MLMVYLVKTVLVDQVVVVVAAHLIQARVAARVYMGKVQTVPVALAHRQALRVMDLPDQVVAGFITVVVVLGITSEGGLAPSESSGPETFANSRQPVQQTNKG